MGSTSKAPNIRVEEHNVGTNIWSKNNRPLKLIYYESFMCKQDAINKEIFFKSGIGRRIKNAIIKELDP